MPIHQPSERAIHRQCERAAVRQSRPLARPFTCSFARRFAGWPTPLSVSFARQPFRSSARQRVQGKIITTAHYVITVAEDNSNN